MSLMLLEAAPAQRFGSQVPITKPREGERIPRPPEAGGQGEWGRHAAH